MTFGDGVRAALPYLETRTAAASSDVDAQPILADALRVVKAWERQTHGENNGIADMPDLDFDADDPGYDRDEGDDISEVVARGSKGGASDRSRMISLLQHSSQ
jgi:hypothetical protein